LTRAHAVDSATRWGRHLAVVAIGATMELGRSWRTLLMMMLLRPPAARFSYRVIAKQAALNDQRFRAPSRVPPLYPLSRAHEGRAGMSAVDSATCWGRLGGAVAAGRRRPFVLAKCGIRFGADDGARAIGADDDVMLRPPRRRRATGSSPRCGIERSAV